MLNYFPNKVINFRNTLLKGAEKCYLIAYPVDCRRVLTNDVKLISSVGMPSEYRFGRSKYIAVPFDPAEFNSEIMTRLKRIEPLLKCDYEYYVVYAEDLHDYLAKQDVSPEYYFSVRLFLVQNYKFLLHNFEGRGSRSLLYSSPETYSRILEAMSDSVPALEAVELEIEFPP